MPYDTFEAFSVKVMLKIVFFTVWMHSD